MLIQFIVQNYLSFSDKEESVFRMTATSDGRHTNHLIEIESQKINLLRTAAIYGANAAGKTNLVKALAFLKRIVTKGTDPKKKIPLKRFKLGKNSAQEPTKFEIEILKNEIHYSYGIILDDSRIREEWLFSTKPHGRETNLFERTTSKDGVTKIEFGAQLKEAGEDFLEFLAKGTRPEQPFIAEAESRNLKQTQPFVDWFRDVLSIVSVEPIYRPLHVRVSQDKDFAEGLGSFLKAAGTGIEEIATKTETLDFSSQFPGMPDAVKQDILNDLNGKNHLILGGVGIEDDLVVINGTREKPEIHKLYTVHKTSDGKKIQFTFGEESSGTKKLIHLFPALFSLMQGERVYIVDELDRSMHPLLSKLFLTTFLDSKKKKSQFIFTTHEECLLDLDLLRRDEVWFIEKDTDQASKCYPLTDYKIRPDVELRKGYLNGRFGGIPFFGDTSKLGW